MVTDPGTAAGAHGLRPLSIPRLVAVQVDDLGVPTALLRGRQVVPVTAVEEVWRVAEAWWRDESLARTYVRLVVADGRLLDLFHDDTQAPAAGWYEQRYS